MTLGTGAPISQRSKNRLGFLDSATGAEVEGIVIVDNTGAAVGSSLNDYKVSNIDADASPNFYGFEKADGEWYILKETLAIGADVYEYLKGVSDLATSWGTRVANSYDTFSNTF